MSFVVCFSNKVNKIQMNYNQNSYTWIEGDFTQDLNYSMNISVISSHNGTNVTTESRDFTIDTRKIGEYISMSDAISKQGADNLSRPLRHICKVVWCVSLMLYK